MTSITRAAAVLAIAAICLIPASCTRGKSQYAHMTKIGDFILWSINDSVSKAAPDMLMLDGKPLETGEANISTNFYALKTQRKTYLFDTGTGNGTVAKLGDAGIDPGMVDVVYLTHVHPDHIGGLVKNGKPVFPNAKIYVSMLESKKMDYMDPASPLKKQYDEICRLYSEKVVVYRSEGEEIEPGITPMSAGGHTPGHTIYKVESRKDCVVICGDIFHNLPEQLKNRDVYTKFDDDPEGAVSARNDLLDLLEANPSAKCAGMHIDFPGIGRIKRDGDKYTYTPDAM